MKKKLAYRAQAFFLKALFALFQWLRPKQASQLGGFILSAIAPFLSKQNSRAKHHLDLIYPHKTVQEKQDILNSMWRNIGMNLGEYPHLKQAYDGHKDFKIDVKGVKHLGDTKTPTVYISAHIGNWEILPLMVAREKRAFHALFRPPNNLYLRRKLNKFRTLNGLLPPALTKGKKGFVALAKKLKNGEDIGILLDQKHSGGKPLPFFGHNAMTSLAPIELALKYETRIILGRIVRNDPCDFTLEILPPLEMANKDAQQIMEEIHTHYETWINEHPDQWLWMHRRWGKNIRQES